MQQDMQTDAACNIQQCCVRLHVAQLKLCLCFRKRSLPEHRTHCLNLIKALCGTKELRYTVMSSCGTRTSAKPARKCFKLNCIGIKYFMHTSPYLGLIVWGITVLHYRIISTENPIETEIKKQNHKISMLKNQKRNVHLFMRTSCRIFRRPNAFLLK